MISIKQGVEEEQYTDVTVVGKALMALLESPRLTEREIRDAVRHYMMSHDIACVNRTCDGYRRYEEYRFELVFEAMSRQENEFVVMFNIYPKLKQVRSFVIRRTDCHCCGSREEKEMFSRDHGTMRSVTYEAHWKNV